MKNAFYSLMNAFFAVLHCYRMFSSQFKIVRLMDRKLSLTFSRETLENGFFELMNAF